MKIKHVVRVLVVIVALVALAGFVLLNVGLGVFADLVNRSNVTDFMPDTAYAALLDDTLAVRENVYTCDDVPVFAARADGAVPDDPAQRYQLTQHFYEHGGLGHGYGVEYGFGKGQLDFTTWEYNRGVLADAGGSSWWRAVNGLLLRDMLEAHYLDAAGLRDCTASTPSAEAWLAYLRQPSSSTWYVAHNASISAGYEQFEALAEDEPLAEQIVMANTLYRVTLADFMITTSDFISRLSDPGGPAVDWITSIASLYPTTYPLSEEDAYNAALLYLVEGNPLTYLDATQDAAADYLREHGMDEAELVKLMPDGDEGTLYEGLFPGFDPLAGAAESGAPLGAIDPFGTAADDEGGCACDGL
jgi:hypothetical protein